VKILFVAVDLPVPPNSGQAIRNLSILQALQSGGHEVTFVCLAHKGRPKDLRPLSSFCRSIEILEREMTNLTQKADYLRRIKLLLVLRSFSVERFKSKAMRKTIEQRLQMEKYDLIICDGIHALTNVPETKVPIALNCHFFEHVILEQYAQLERNPFKRYYARIESRLMQIAERRGSRRVSRAMVCSEADVRMVRRFRHDLSVFVVPNVVDTDSIHPAERSPADGSDSVLLFSGQMDWYPNRDAVEYFARSILPRVRSEFPKVRFVVAGRNPPPQFVEQFRSDPGIEFTGTVVDIRPYLAAATIVVVPLRFGSGTRIKILEACAAGKLVVSTRIGAEGLILEEGKEIIVADDPAEFARSVIGMLRDPVQRDAVAGCSRTAVTERYSHLALKKSLEAFISSCLSEDSL